MKARALNGPGLLRSWGVPPTQTQAGADCDDRGVGIRYLAAARHPALRRPKERSEVGNRCARPSPSMSAPERNHRILVIDDNHAIHADIRKILCPQFSEADASLSALESALLGTAAPASAAARIAPFTVDSAYQGREGLALVEKAEAAGTALRDGVRRRADASGLGRRRDDPRPVEGRPGPPGGHLHGLFGLFLGGHALQDRGDRPAGHPEEAVRHGRGPPARQRADREMEPPAADPGPRRGVGAPRPGPDGRPRGDQRRSPAGDRPEGPGRGRPEPGQGGGARPPTGRRARSWPT